jgi:hypothetical protein
VPIFEKQPGFVRYEIGKLDNGGIVSFSIWETSEEAQRAVDLAAGRCSWACHAVSADVVQAGPDSLNLSSDASDPRKVSRAQLVR